MYISGVWFFNIYFIKKIFLKIFFIMWTIFKVFIELQIVNCPGVCVCEVLHSLISSVVSHTYRQCWVGIPTTYCDLSSPCPSVNTASGAPVPKPRQPLTCSPFLESVIPKILYGILKCVPFGDWWATACALWGLVFVSIFFFWTFYFVRV